MIDKNIKLLGGHPLLSYRIESVKETRSSHDLWITTDSESYASIAQKYGAEVPFIRPKELSTDIVSSVDVVLHAMEHAKQFNKEFKQLWKKINPQEEAIIQYKPPKKEDKNSFVVNLRGRFDKDKLRGQTGVGPHKDKINFFFGDIDIKNQASQGERKIFLIVLKIAEAKYLHQTTSKKPVLLLDDLFAKLDKSKGEKILQLINSKYQTFITTTDNSIESYFDNFETVNFIKLENNNKLCSVA